jgi:hypothetical protein
VPKWFYDTSTSSATGAGRCGSFVGGGCRLLVTSYGWTWWIRRFTWFGPLERNTLRPRENWVILLRPALPEPAFLSALVKRCLPEPFIAQGWAVTLRLEAWQMTPRCLKLYTASRILMARSSKWYLARYQQRGAVMSYRSAALNMTRPVVPSYRVVSPL